MVGAQTARPEGEAVTPELTAFDDMRLRVINNAPCPVEFLDSLPGCFPYGLLIFSLDDAGIHLQATFGDLTVSPVRCHMMIKLIRLATGAPQ